MAEQDSRVISFTEAAAARGRVLKPGNPLISTLLPGAFGGVRVEGLSKKLGAAELLSGVSFEARAGECFGILGENGSGKTTLLRLISGLAFPTGGVVGIAGKNPHTDPVGALGMMSAMIGIPAFYPHIGAFDNLSFSWTVDGTPDKERIMGSLDAVGLADEAGKKVGAYSRGMLQRLGVALVLMQDRPLAVLDEPTQGVDTVWVEKLAAIFREMAGKGKALLITSHDFDFVTSLCERVLILDGGKTVYQGRLKEIAEFPYYFHLRATPGEKAAATLAKLEYVHKAVHLEEGFELTIKAEMASALVAALVAAGCQVHECAQRHYSIVDLVAQRRANGRA